MWPWACSPKRCSSLSAAGLQGRSGACAPAPPRLPASGWGRSVPRLPGGAAQLRSALWLPPVCQAAPWPGLATLTKHFRCTTVKEGEGATVNVVRPPFTSASRQCHLPPGAAAETRLLGPSACSVQLGPAPSEPLWPPSPSLLLPRKCPHVLSFGLCCRPQCLLCRALLGSASGQPAHCGLPGSGWVVLGDIHPPGPQGSAHRAAPTTRTGRVLGPRLPLAEPDSQRSCDTLSPAAALW